MKKFNEIYAEALKDEELRNELTQAVSERKITEFLKAHDCDSDTEEIIEFLTEQQAKTQRGDIELNIDDLEDVAGGANRFVAALLAGLTLTSALTPIAAAAAEDNSVPTEYVLDVEQEEDDIDLDFDIDDDTAEETTQTTAETTTETTETTVETFVPLDLVKEEEKKFEPAIDNSYDDFMNDAVSSLWEMGKSKLGENLPLIMDKIFDSIPVVNSLNKIGIGKALGGLLANVLGISPEKQPTMKEISDQIKELSEHIDSVKAEIISHADNNLAREIEAMENVSNVSTYKYGMQQLALAFNDINGKIAKTSQASEQERLVQLASLCGSSSSWQTEGTFVRSLVNVGSYMSGQSNFISGDNYYDALYSLAVKHGAIFSGQAKREVNEYVTNSLETYTAAYAYAMASLNAQEVLVKIKNSDDYDEFLMNLPKDMRNTCEEIKANQYDIKAKKEELTKLFMDIEEKGNTNTVLGQYDKFVNKSDSIFIKRDGQFDRESRDIAIGSVAICCDSDVDQFFKGLPKVYMYANLMNNNDRVTGDTQMINTILAYAKKYDMTIAQVLESAGFELPADTRYILAGTEISSTNENYDYHETSTGYLGAADIVYQIEAYDIYSKNLSKVKVPIKSVKDIKRTYDNSKYPDERECRLNYVNTINFMTFCNKPDNSSVFGSVIDNRYYSLSSGTYVLDEDINLSAYVDIPVGANVTVDLNGHTINRCCNKSETYGMVFSVSMGANLTIIDSAGNGKVTGGYASNGGAVYIGTNATCTVKGGIFTGNRADMKGGAFYNGGTLNIENAIVSGNTAHEGGAVYNMENRKLNITDSQLDSNKAEKQGGAVFTEGEAKITGSDFRNNFAASGGAISAYSGLTMDNFSITGNSALWGGGFYLQTSAKLTNGTINDNTAQGEGGAMQISNKSKNLADDMKKEAIAKILPSAFAINNAINHTVEITNVEMNGNKANNGGAVYNNSGLVVRNCNICNNTANDRGGAFNLSGISNTKVYDSYICDNSASKGSLLRFEEKYTTYTIDNTNTTNGSIY